MTNERNGSLLAWQWSGYEKNHRDRKNLLVHALTVPLFHAGTVALVLTPAAPIAGLGGVAAMVLAVALQGRSHRHEQAAPAAFRSPWDFLARLLVEQWVTFPRFVLSRGFGRAWRGQSSSAALCGG